MKVLIVDDNVAVQEILKDILTGAGHTVRMSGSMEEAVDKFLLMRPDAVILDMKVGAGEGVSLISRMKEANSSLPLNVILVKSSADAEPTGIPEIKAVIDKPFKSTDILDALNEVEIVEDESAPAKKKRRLFSGRQEKTRVPQPTVTPNERGIELGTSYVLFEKEPEHIYDFAGLFHPEHYSVLLITTGRAKQVKEKFDYNGIEVWSLGTGILKNGVDVHSLGTIVHNVKEFIGQKASPVVIFDDLADIIEANGLSNTLFMIHQFISENKGRKWTLAVSLDEALLNEKDRGILVHDLKVYEYRGN